MRSGWGTFWARNEGDCTHTTLQEIADLMDRETELLHLRDTTTIDVVWSLREPVSA